MRDPAKLVRGLLQREVDSRFAVPRALEEELQAEQRLSRPRPALDDRRARTGQPAAEHGVEPGDPGRGPLRASRPAGRACRGLRADAVGAPHAREEREPVGPDLEEVAAGDVVRAAQLQHLDLADGGQLVAGVREPDDAVGDRELGMARGLRLGVLADEQARRSPARGVDGEVVDERPQGRGVAEDVPDRLEAVDDHDRRLLALHAARDLVQRGLRALAPDHGAEVGEDDPSLEQALVEERELLHVLEELQRRLGERREVQALLALPRQGEEHLEREQGLARARLSGDHVDGADGEPAAEDAVEAGAARREAFQDRTASSSRLLLPLGDDAPVAKLGDLRETIDDDGPGQLHEQRPELTGELAQRLLADAGPGRSRRTGRCSGIRGSPA